MPNDSDERFFPEGGLYPCPVRVPVGVRAPLEHVWLRSDRGPLLQDVVGRLAGHGRQALGDLVGLVRDRSRFKRYSQDRIDGCIYRKMYSGTKSRSFLQLIK